MNIEDKSNNAEDVAEAETTVSTPVESESEAGQKKVFDIEETTARVEELKVGDSQN